MRINYLNCPNCGRYMFSVTDAPEDYKYTYICECKKAMNEISYKDMLLKNIPCKTCSERYFLCPVHNTRTLIKDSRKDLSLLIESTCGYSLFEMNNLTKYEHEQFVEHISTSEGLFGVENV